MKKLITNIIFMCLNNCKPLLRNSTFLTIIKLLNGGNNLWHIACTHQDIRLLKIAKESKQCIDSFNKSGLLPIHILLLEMFELKPSSTDSNVNVFSYIYNKEFFSTFFNHSPKLDLFWLKRPAHIKNYHRSIFGYPIEILCMHFRDFIVEGGDQNINPNFIIYEEIFKHLYVIDEKEIEKKKTNIKKYSPLDTIDYYKISSISAFFIIYTKTDKDWMVVLPFISNPFINFKKQNNNDGHTILHLVFSKIHSQIKKNPLYIIENILMSIINNPSFELNDINEQSYLGNSPISLFRKDSLFVIDYFKTIQLHKDLLNIKHDIEPKEYTIDTSEYYIEKSDDNYFKL